MKLDPTVMRTMHASDFRVLEAVEQGMNNHALVPLPLISSLAGLRRGCHKIVSSLLRDNLLSHENTKLDGYRLTNAGYDILALSVLKQRGLVSALGQRIGTGKESDIYLAVNAQNQHVVLKFHRLGRNSFRNVRNKRDYLRNNSHVPQHSWLFLSRLSALREYAFLRALHEVRYPTPTPLAHNRHVIVMSLVRGSPLYQIHPQRLSRPQACDIYQQALALATRLAQKHGLIHCDLNEFNLLVDLSGGRQSCTQDAEEPYVRHSGSVAPSHADWDSTIKVRASAGVSITGGSLLSQPAWEHEDDKDDPTSCPPIARLANGDPKPVVILIDFPQMISTRHPQAHEYLARDIGALQRFFERKLRCPPLEFDVNQVLVDPDEATEQRLDEELRASGYSSVDGLKELELYYFEAGPQPVSSVIYEVEQDDEHDEDSDDDEEVRDDDNDDDVDGQNNKAKQELIPNDDEDFDCNHADQHLVENSVDSNDEGAVNTAIHEFEFDTNIQADLGANKLDDGVNAKAVVVDLDGMSLLSIDTKRLEEIAKERVRKQLVDQRRKSQRKGAFRKHNSNKTFVKGKRVYSEACF